MTVSARAPRVLIVTEHASARFGGEAALALHWFRVLRARGLEVALVTHERTRDELTALFPDEPRIHFVPDSWLNRALFRAGRWLPDRISYVTCGFASRLHTQWRQRAMVRRLLREPGYDIVHQPMPVSPREPSMLAGFGVPVVIGPMNGGMDYPPAFRRERRLAERVLLRIGRFAAAALNRAMPGKRDAALLLVANERTRQALPAGVSREVHELVENGVDLGLWRAAAPEVRDVRPSATGSQPSMADAAPVTFVFVGRLVDWKAVDLLLEAVAQAATQAPLRLVVIGDGDEGPALRDRASALGLTRGAEPVVEFTGWLTQPACAERLRGADALVLPSLMECGGAVVLEAMALAKPVVATAWGGPADYLDADCGVLVEPASREALIEGFAQAMLRLARSPALRERLGQAGRRKVEREYDWEAKADRMLALFDEVLARRSARLAAA